MIDDTLYEQALSFARPGISREELVNEALLTYIQLQAGRHLANLGGSMPDMADMADIPRRRPDPVAE